MRKIGIFGGTFNPFHNGHRKCIEEIDKSLCFDEILVIPNKLPPHKQTEKLADDIDRLNMCRLGTSDIKKVKVSDIEISKGGKSYSINTIKELTKLYPQDTCRLYFIMGSDMLLSFKNWYKYKEILSLCSLVCISRADDDTKKLDDCADDLKAEGGSVTVVKTEPLEISSTQIREMIKSKKDLSCFLNDLVVKYISENDIYND